MMNTGILLHRKVLQASDPETTFNTSIKRPLYPSPNPIDSSMALTILVLLTALFFMGFFSIYIRRSSAAAAAEDNNNNNPSSTYNPSRPSNNHKINGGGLDISVVNSLPLVAYGEEGAKHRIITDDCLICLGEFVEGECVKLIPYCGHVFHPKCVDTWLSTHVTCPLCRSAQLFKRLDEEEVCLDVARDRDDICVTVVGEGSTWRDENMDGVRRVCSCSDLSNGSGLVRSTSF